MSRAPGGLVACAAVAACGGIPPPSPATGPAGLAAVATPRAGGGGRYRELPPWQRVRAALAVEPLEYVHGLGQLNANARPSSLQPLLKRRQHTLSALCAPRLDLSGLVWRDLQTDRAGELLPPAGVVTLSLYLGSVTGVPESGVKERKRWLSVARLCLYDGAKFLGNVQAVKPREVRPSKAGADTWVFDAEPLLVRCPTALLPHACVYIELNVSYELTAEEAGRLPAKAARAARQVDEITVAWALVELRSVQPRLVGTKSLSTPLRGGPLARQLTLRQCAMLQQQLQVAAAWQQGMQQQQQPKKPLFGYGDPSLAVKLFPVAQQEQGAVAALPELAIVSPPAAKVLGLYRQLLAEGLGCAGGAGTCVAPVPDLAMAAFPAIVDDPDLCHALFQLWDRQTAPLLWPSRGELKRALRRCMALVWAMMGSQAIPKPSIANHTSHQWSRKQRMVEYLAAHPVAALNSDGTGWLHAPFCASELACDPLCSLGVTV